jgi:hypothetical protein
LKTITGWGISLLFFTLGVAIPAEAASVPTVDSWREPSQSAQLLQKQEERRAQSEQPIVFAHGDISWLPQLAAEAGWPKKTWKKLGQIILRESGGCPNRIGSSIVDENCNITGYTRATNKSDSGLLQINGINWDMSRNKNAIACVQFGFCKQKDLLDPVNNLKVGRELFRLAGWDPWDPCAWGPEYAHRCK